MFQMIKTLVCTSEEIITYLINILIKIIIELLKRLAWFIILIMEHTYHGKVAYGSYS